MTLANKALEKQFRIPRRARNPKRLNADVSQRINEMKHKEVIELEQQGKLFIGVDRAMARMF